MLSQACLLAFAYISGIKKELTYLKVLNTLKSGYVTKLINKHLELYRLFCNSIAKHKCVDSFSFLTQFKYAPLTLSRSR